MKNVHIGSVIREKLTERGMRVTEFANALHCNRSSVYSLFERRSIDLELLILISKILEDDLLALYLEDENQRKDYMALIETNELKIKELSSDHLVKIVKTWKTSENSDIL
ncbi:MAG: helix-turn-helix domain-containing protein [Candidatus Symbiothrix sp.]|jgi:plasmid maintenance system antidote protein VapI|nr:helix-turn-helix domain-containing protein [Candidatus Symbiothrix sp.]